jgi:hypothetical protein
MMAATVTLEMDEVTPTQPIDGLKVSKGGIDFTFSDPGGTQQYDFVVPGTQLYLSNPGIAGGLEPFGVTFSVPVYSIQFGMAETSLVPLTGVGVKLFDGATQVYSTTFDLLDTGHPAVENLFTWAADADVGPVTGLEIDPAPIDDPLVGPDGSVLLAGIDNLTVTDTAPEPGSLSLSLLVAGAGILFRRRQRISHS